MRRLFIYSIGIALLISTAMQTPVEAGDLTGTSFIIRDPVINGVGGFGTSSTFQLFSSGDFGIIGPGGTSTGFEGRFGFQYYPYVNVGTLSGTPLGSSVDLDWDASAAGLGFNVSGYNVGISTVSGSGYSYTSLGNVLTYTYTNLVPDTYYFVVQTKDAFGNVIGVSNEVEVEVTQSIAFSISDNTVGFGTLGLGSARYATNDATGTTTLTPAHELEIATNANSGYTVTYRGPLLSGTADTISSATITADIDGAPGTEQFAISADTDGDATIPGEYDVSSYNWDYDANVDTTIAYEAGMTDLETISLYYLANIGSNTSSGGYSSFITYTATANF